MRRLLLSTVLISLALCACSASTPGTAATPVCRAGALAAQVSLEGCAGTLCGTIVFRNRSREKCSVYGYPGIVLWNRRVRLPVRIARMPESLVQQLTGAAVSRVLLRPGRRAGVLFQWGNWCGRTLHAPLLLDIFLPSHAGTITINGGTTDPHQVVSECTNARYPPGGSVGPFTPYPLPVPTPVP